MKQKPRPQMNISLCLLFNGQARVHVPSPVLIPKSSPKRECKFCTLGYTNKTLTFVLFWVLLQEPSFLGNSSKLGESWVAYRILCQPQSLCNKLGFRMCRCRTWGFEAYHNITHITGSSSLNLGLIIIIIN